MWACKPCLTKMQLDTPEVLTIHACSVCSSSAVECAEMNGVFNNGNPNWHKYSEDKDCIPKADLNQIPENGLYLWLRPITQIQQ